MTKKPEQTTADLLRAKLKERTGQQVRVEGMHVGDFLGTVHSAGFTGCEFRVDEPFSTSEEAPKGGQIIWLPYSSHMHIREVGSSEQPA